MMMMLCLCVKYPYYMYLEELQKKELMYLLPDDVVAWEMADMRASSSSSSQRRIFRAVLLQWSVA